MNDGRIVFERERQALAEVIELTYYRKNTNTAGGNFSFKTRGPDGEDYLIMTPSMMSEAYHGKVSPSQILVVNPETCEIITGEGELTREINMHTAAYKANSDIKCVFHAHAPNAMFWATSHLNLPNLTEATQKVTQIEVLDFEPNCSPELAEIVSRKIKSDLSLPKEYLLDSHGVLILTPGETGVVALHKALSILDTVEWNADIAYKQTIFQQMGLLDGYYSKGVKVGDLSDLVNRKPIWNNVVADSDGD
ncbi:class II aldolase/adducin family protein [uncultured Vagococcus sp.]|uniref:class II aldolase/adducin family protein n=1 Tax=uncultured Vagococcus sp. TaxID=189676 RepID=UPI0028D25FF2|nr:class II aldolase/adducin family protein [uncultured Vagococcus sp.]